VSSPRPQPSADAPAAERRLSLGRLARARPKTIVALWLLLAAVLGARVWGGAGIRVSGAIHGLVPPGDRPNDDEPMVLLRLRASEDTAAPDSDQLLDAADAVAEQLGEQRVPIAPPRAELTGWLDAHALYLLSPVAQQQLEARLTDEAMTDAIEGLRARLSSPLYGLMDEDPRRDPLALRELGAGAAEAYGEIGRKTGRGAGATASGDLLSADGASVLMQLSTSRGPDELQAEIASALGDRHVDAYVVGPAATGVRVAAHLRETGPRLLSLVAAGLAVVLALALRAIRPVVSILLALATGVLGLLWLAPDLDAYGASLVILLCGFGCEGALHLQRISARGWPGAAVMGTALLPLALSPYPVWQRWGLWWLGGIALVSLALRLAMPALSQIVGGPTSLAAPGFRLRPSRLVAVVLSVGALATGAWAAQRASFRGFDRLTADLGTIDSAGRTVRDEFFDPSRVVEARSRGASPAEALERAAADARRLQPLVPASAVRIDSPGLLVLVESEIAERRVELQRLQLRERMDSLSTILESRGFRPDAFGEFLRSSADLELAPTAGRAVDGPLGHWVRRYLESDGGAFAIRNRIHLGPDANAAPPAPVDESGAAIELRGPAIAARRDRVGFADQLGVFVAAQLWLGALFVWLGTRSLPVALAAAITALSAQTAVLGVMIPLRIPLGPHLVPALLLTGASALVAGARACQAVALRRPIYATGLLVTGLCQVAAGLALVGAGIPLWGQIGLCVAIGASIASGAGLFVAPGLARLFSLRIETPEEAEREAQDAGDDDDDDTEDHAP
jgi:hypothetical protein